MRSAETEGVSPAEPATADIPDARDETPLSVFADSSP